MSQTYAAIASGADLSTFRATINGNCDALLTLHKGPSAPSSPVAGMLWLDDDTPSATVWTLKMYDGTDWIEVGRFDTTNNVFQVANGAKLTAALDANSFKITNLATGTAAGDAVNKGQVDARIMQAFSQIGTQTGTFDRYVFRATAAVTIVNAYLINNGSTTSDGSNKWTFQLRNLTAGNDLLSTAKTTNGAEIAADTAYALTPNQNLTLAAGDIIELQAVETGTATSLGTQFACQITYTVPT